MQADELLARLQALIEKHGSCPVYHEERGSYETSLINSIRAITQGPLPPGSPSSSQTMVPVGTTYFWID